MFVFNQKGETSKILFYVPEKLELIVPPLCILQYQDTVQQRLPEEKLVFMYNTIAKKGGKFNLQHQNGRPSV